MESQWGAGAAEQIGPQVDRAGHRLHDLDEMVSTHGQSTRDMGLNAIAIRQTRLEANLDACEQLEAVLVLESSHGFFAVCNGIAELVQVAAEQNVRQRRGIDAESAHFRSHALGAPG